MSTPDRPTTSAAEQQDGKEPSANNVLRRGLASAFHEGVAVAVLVAVGRGGGVVAAAPACLGSASVLLSPSPGRGGVWLGSLDWPGTGR
jgi:hypothetical protein